MLCAIPGSPFKAPRGGIIVADLPHFHCFRDSCVCAWVDPYLRAFMAFDVANGAANCDRVQRELIDPVRRVICRAHFLHRYVER